MQEKFSQFKNRISWTQLGFTANVWAQLGTEFQTTTHEHYFSIISTLSLLALLICYAFRFSTSVYFKRIFWGLPHKEFSEFSVKTQQVKRKSVLMRGEKKEKETYSRWTLEERHFSKLQLVLQSGSWNYQTWRVTKATAGGSRQSRRVCVCVRVSEIWCSVSHRLLLARVLQRTWPRSLFVFCLFFLQEESKSAGFKMRERFYFTLCSICWLRNGAFI